MTLAPPAGERLAPHRIPAPPRRVTLVMAPGRGERRALRPPLELAAIGAALRALGAEVRLVDLRLAGSTIEASDPADALLLWGTDTAELTTLASELRTLLSGRELLAGGPGLDADALLGGQLVDLVLLDGDVATVDRWYRARLDGRGDAGCRGLAWRAPGGAVVREPALLPPMDPDALPAPAWDLVRVDAYGAVPLVTSRSCGPRCEVCHHSYGHVVRARTLAHVWAEVDALVARGVRTFRLEDEPLNLDPRRAAALVRGLAQRAVRVELTAPLRVDRIDAELAGALAGVGIRRVEVDLEGTSPRAQREARLNLNLDDARVGIELLAAAGIRVRGRFTLGRPGETPEEHRDTVAWARRSALDGARFEGGAGRRRAWLWFHLSPRRWARRLGLGRSSATSPRRELGPAR